MKVSPFIYFCVVAVTACGLFALVSCQTGPDGKRHYVGPNITGSIGFQGVTASVTLWTDLTAITPKKPLGPMTLPETVLGVPINTK